MRDLSKLVDATDAVADPSTTTHELFLVAQLQPSLRSQIAEHPNGQLALRQWAHQHGGANIDFTVEQGQQQSDDAQCQAMVTDAQHPAADTVDTEKPASSKQAMSVTAKIVVITVALVLIVTAVTWLLIARYDKPGGRLNQWQFSVVAQHTWPKVSGMPAMTLGKRAIAIDLQVQECPQAYARFKEHWLDYASNESTKLNLFDTATSADSFPNAVIRCGIDRYEVSVTQGYATTSKQYDSGATVLGYGVGDVTTWLISYRNVLLSTPVGEWDGDMDSAVSAMVKAVDQA